MFLFIIMRRIVRTIEMQPDSLKSTVHQNHTVKCYLCVNVFNLHVVVSLYGGIQV